MWVCDRMYVIVGMGEFVRVRCDYVMWVCDRMYVIVGMGEFVRVRYVSSHAHVGVYAYSCLCEWF